MLETLLVLVSAHFIADFLLQPDWLQQRKEQPWAIMLHSASVAGLSYLFLQQWRVVMLVGLVFLFHAFLDSFKRRFRDSCWLFCMDQVAHVVSTFLILRFCMGMGALEPFHGEGIEWMVLVAGFAVSVQGAGFLVGKVTATLQEENALAEKIKGLKNGGKWIGQLERALIFLLIVIGQPTGIGFLVAAKSILRFGEAKDDQQLAEYVLIGTLLSFGLAIAAASLTMMALKTVLSWKLSVHL